MKIINDLAEMKYKLIIKHLLKYNFIPIIYVIKITVNKK